MEWKDSDDGTQTENSEMVCLSEKQSTPRKPDFRADEDQMLTNSVFSATNTLGVGGEKGANGSARKRARQSFLSDDSTLEDIMGQSKTAFYASPLHNHE